MYPNNNTKIPCKIRYSPEDQSPLRKLLNNIKLEKNNIRKYIQQMEDEGHQCGKHYAMSIHAYSHIYTYIYFIFASSYFLICYFYINFYFNVIFIQHVTILFVCPFSKSSSYSVGTP